MEFQIKQWIWKIYVKLEDRKRNWLATLKIRRGLVEPPKTLHIAKIKHEVKNG